jgi:GNAT superfamily N-acetyltransferase
MPRPLPFPLPRKHGLPVAEGRLPWQVRLRWAVDGDLPALRALYATTREQELAPVPWAQVVKDRFVDEQFALQHHHYLTHFADADFLVVDSREGLAGRLYRWRAPDDAPPGASDILVDICLLPQWRGRGIGEALLAATLAQGAERRRDVCLHVHATNVRARQLYERLGFTCTGEAGLHVEMRWRAAA